MSSDGTLQFQGCNEQGELIKEAPVFSAAAQKGALHASSHVWVWHPTDNGIELLLQKRAARKLTWPGYWDASAAGHVDFGEEPLTAALRETEEEIGLRLKPASLQLLFVYRQHLQDDVSGVIENEFQWVYGHCYEGSAEFIVDESEVAMVKWVGVGEFRRLIANKSTPEIVLQGDAYFHNLLHALGEDNDEGH